MTVLYIDADACPMREEAFRVATRLRVDVAVVSNGSRPIRPPGLPNVRMVIVNDTPDAADDWIAERIGRGDVCVTADIPLASRCLGAGGRALSWTGHVWTGANIGNALAGREVSRHLREIGAGGGGQAAMTKADRSRFLSSLDTVMVGALREGAAGSAPPSPPAKS